MGAEEAARSASIKASTQEEWCQNTTQSENEAGRRARDKPKAVAYGAGNGAALMLRQETTTTQTLEPRVCFGENPEANTGP